jgi:c-di-GMP-related signal transduction protein
MRFAARQPIFTRKMSVFGYEILFRSGFEAAANIQDPDQASFATLDTSILWGLDQLCDDKFAFVNCTRAVLTNRIIELLPPSRTVVEVLEDVLPDESVLDACRALKQKGYLIALDDVQCLTEVAPYLALADIVKVDFRLTNSTQQRDIAREVRPLGLQVLAEKVEDGTEHRLAMDAGYELFQGFFFQKPEMLRQNNIQSLHSTCCRVLSAVQRTELQRKEIAALIKGEPSLSFRLLRYLNSYAFSLRFEVVSIEHALHLLGDDELRKWLLVSVVMENCINRPSEVVLWALGRARFCEGAADALPHPVPGGFWMGMASALPVLLDTSLANILEQMPLPAAVKQALLGDAGPHRDLLELLTSYERGDWQACAFLAARLGIPETAISALYINAMQWARAVMNDTGSPSTAPSLTEGFASYRPPEIALPDPPPSPSRPTKAPTTIASRLPASSTRARASAWHSCRHSKAATKADE